MQQVLEKFNLKNNYAKCFFAELTGVYLLMVIGLGGTAQAALSSKGIPFAATWGWALGVTLGILVSSNISGGHINPAVSLMSAVLGRLPWRKLLVYWPAQYLGSFLAAATIYGIYHESLIEAANELQSSGNKVGIASIFAIYPAVKVPVVEAFFEEVLSSFIFALCVCLVSDTQQNVPRLAAPFVLGSCMLGICVSLGSNFSAAVNPARDLPPRLFTYLVGWGRIVFSFHGFNWFWIFTIAPYVGTFVAVIFYNIFIAETQPAEHNHAIPVTLKAEYTTGEEDYHSKTNCPDCSALSGAQFYPRRVWAS